MTTKPIKVTDESEPSTFAGGASTSNLNVRGSTDAFFGGRLGRGTLDMGTAIISNDSLTELTRIMVTPDATGGVVGVVGERVSARTIGPGGSFTIQSTIPTDTNSFTWFLMEEIAAF